MSDNNNQNNSNNTGSNRSDGGNLSKFIELMTKEDLESKQSGIKLIPKVITESQGEKNLNELLAFIWNTIDDEDETLISEFLSIIPNIIPLQGNKSFTSKLLPLIELGLISYNSKVREEALAMYKVILKECISASKDYDVYEFVQKLSNQINQKYRVALLLVIPTVYRHLNSNQKTKISCFLKQFSDEGNEYIKKMLAINLKELSYFIPDDVFSVIITSLLKCTNDNIRIPLIGSIVSLKYHQNLNLFQNQIQKVVASVGTDESWRVRYTLASSVHDLLSFSIISSGLKKEIITQYSQLFKDKEEEVRNICIANLGASLDKLKEDNDSINVLMDAFEKAVNVEISPIVKETIAESIVSISKNVPKTKLKSVIVPICYELLKSFNKDDTSLTPQIVKSNVSLSPVNDKKAILKSTSPIITKKTLPQKSHESLLESYLGKNNNNSSEKSSITPGSVLVYDNSGLCGAYTQVQLKMIKNIPMIQKYSQHNFETILITSINSIFGSSKWKNKVKLLDIINDIISFFSQTVLAADILEILLKGLQENVYLIRQSAINCLVEVLQKVQSDEINNKVYKILSTLKSSTNFQMRKCCALFILSYTKKKNSNESFILNNLIPIVFNNLVKDKVKNIRAICGSIVANLNIRNKSLVSKYSKVIEEYSNDLDEEVKSSITIS